MASDIKEEQVGAEMDPETSVSFDLSLAASHEFCRRRKRVLENMASCYFLSPFLCISFTLRFIFSNLLFSFLTKYMEESDLILF